MADYQSLLTRAVANLPPSSTAAARQAIYERARKALVTQLRSLRPPLPESDIQREETSLDKAIEAVEAKFAPVAEGQASVAAPPVAEPVPHVGPSPQAPPPPSPQAPPPHSPQPPVPPKTAPSPDAAPRPAPSAKPAAAPSPAAHTPAPSASPVPPPRVAPLTSRPVETRPAETRFAEPRPVGPARPSAPVAPSRPAPPPVSARPAGPSQAEAAKPPPVQVSSPNATGAAAPPVIASKGNTDASDSANLATVVPSDEARAVETSGAPPIVSSVADDAESLALAPEVPLDGERVGLGRPEAEGLRPVAPSAPVEGRRSWPWAALALVLGIVLSVAVVAIVMRQKPQDLAINPPTASAPEANQGPAKIAQRAQPPSAETAPPSQPSPPSASPPQGAQAPAEGAAPANAPQPSPGRAATAERGAGGDADRLGRQSPEAGRQPRLDRLVDDSRAPGTAERRRGRGRRRYPRPQDARIDDPAEERRSDAAGYPYHRPEVHLPGRRALQRVQGRRPAADAQARTRPPRRP